MKANISIDFQICISVPLSSVARELSVSLLILCFYNVLNKTKKSKCGYCSKEIPDDNLKQHCKEVHEKPKLVTGQKTLAFSTTQEEPQKKAKSDNGENLSSSYSAVQLEESTNSVNTLNIESISKSENSAKSIASSSETSSADENGRKLNMILSEMSKLNSKLSEKRKPCKQANELPKSDEHSDKLINQLNHCKTIADYVNPLIIFLTFPWKNHLFLTYVSYTLLKVALTPQDAFL